MFVGIIEEARGTTVVRTLEMEKEMIEMEKEMIVETRGPLTTDSSMVSSSRSERSGALTQNYSPSKNV